jgi:hypothetical protein
MHGDGIVSLLLPDGDWFVKTGLELSDLAKSILACGEVKQKQFSCRTKGKRKPNAGSSTQLKSST